MKHNVTATLALLAMLGSGAVLACDGAPAATDASAATPKAVASKPVASHKVVYASTTHARQWVNCVGNDCARPVVAACTGKECDQPLTR